MCILVTRCGFVVVGRSVPMTASFDASDHKQRAYQGLGAPGVQRGNLGAIMANGPRPNFPMPP